MDAWTPHVVAVAAELSDLSILDQAQTVAADIKAGVGRNSLWMVIKTEAGASVALRTAHAPDCVLKAVRTRAKGALMAFDAEADCAAYRVRLEVSGQRLLRVTTWIRPKAPLLIDFWPRDLYPLGTGDDPTRARGVVLAAQRGLNGGVCFIRMEDPSAAVLYFQNLTALNPWFNATDTSPESAVGGEWPELGYQPPGGTDLGEPPRRPLPAGQEIVLSDVFLYLPVDAPQGEIAEADTFLQGLAAVYPHLEQPQTQYRDWPRLARRGLRALTSPKAGVTRYSCWYLRPYTDAEVPDSMAQLATLLPVRDFGKWRGRPFPLEHALRAGVKHFFDPKLGTVRRYLPNVSDGTETIEKAKDKDPDEVDSWYLYHPLANLGRLALDGDEEAKEIFLGSVDFGIKVARHFDYAWPVLFNVKTLGVNTGARAEGQPGQSDVGGLYAYVMMQAHELTGHSRFFDEAAKAMRKTRGLGFALLYQTNISAWGIAACARLWKATGDPMFKEQSHLFLAGFFHNCVLWESDVRNARHYSTFLGATCLHDAPYMAIYECFESFCAFRDYLDVLDEAAPPAIRLLLNEYCRHALHRAWGFYPGEVPAEILAKENIRNGYIDRTLPFPVEDLYADGQAMGQVGQEIYGAGAAFAFATRAFHRRPPAPFTVFCDYPVRGIAARAGEWSGHIEGWPEGECRVRVMARPDVIKGLTIEIDHAAGEGRTLEPGVWEGRAPGRAKLLIRWKPTPSKRRQRSQAQRRLKAARPA